VGGWGAKKAREEKKKRKGDGTEFSQKKLCVKKRGRPVESILPTLVGEESYQTTWVRDWVPEVPRKRMRNVTRLFKNCPKRENSVG